MECPFCHEEHPAEAVFCPNTGKSLARMNPLFCPNCSRPIDADWALCAYCGYSIHPTGKQTSRSRSSRWVAVTAVAVLVLLSALYLADRNGWITFPAFLQLRELSDGQAGTEIPALGEATGVAAEDPDQAAGPMDILGLSDADYVTTQSGLKYHDEVIGEGKLAVPGDQLTVHYTGWLEDGTLFDSSVDRSTPFEFTLGAGSLIAGWDEGVAGMRVGGVRTLVIPPDLAYGSSGSPPIIPGDATLIFKVELLGIQANGIYFLTGHGEYSIDATGDSSLSLLRQELTQLGYSTDSLNLLATAAIPADARLMIIAGPLQPVTPPEMFLIANFVAAGGGLIVAQEPVPMTEFGDADDPVAAYLLDTWGILLGDDLVVDLNAFQLFDTPFVAIANEYHVPAITAGLLQRQLVTIFPSARSVQVVDSGIPDVDQTELILTSEQSWAETDSDSVNDGSLEVDDLDLAGPVPLAVAAENHRTNGRIVVFGDVDFFSDSTLLQFGNKDLILAAIQWIFGP